MSIKEYVVTLKDRNDLEGFYEDMETEGGNLYIPNRTVKLADRRPNSRNTHYMLTEDEAAQLRNDPRVLAVELTPRELGLVATPMYVQTSINWDRGTTLTTAQRNWGLYRCTLNSNVANWGFRKAYNDTTAATPSASGTINITASGKNVDVIIVDGHFDPTHPEYAVNENGTGGSRVNQFNWFSLNPQVTGTAPATYVYTPYVDPTNSDRTSDNDHGAHVAGTACGNSQGWARDANIYNINPYGTNVNILNELRIFDYIREFHRSKTVNPATGRRNPTLVNNSWGFAVTANVADISLIFYKGQQINGPFTESQLANYGLQVSLNTVYVQYRYPALDVDVEDAINDGIIFVGAAGNSSYKIDSTTGADYNNYFRAGGFNYYYHRGMSPTATGSALCIGAISANADETKAYFSNCGPRIDLYAPGDNILSSINSTTVNNTYDFRNEFKYITKFDGTSMASPQVCGVVACILEIYPNWNQASVNNYIRNSAKVGVITDTAGGYTDLYSLQGSANRFLFYKRERAIEGQVLPKAVSGLRPMSGQVYPRPKIYSYGPQSTG